MPSITISSLPPRAPFAAALAAVTLVAGLSFSSAHAAPDALPAAQIQSRPADRAATLRARHAGEVLARVRIDTPAELSRLRLIGADQWTHGDQLGWHEFRLTPAHLALLQEMDLEHEIIRDDVGDLLATETERLAAAAAEGAIAGADFFGDYRPLEMVEAFVDGLVADHPGLATKTMIGQTIEGRPIHALTITGGDASDRPSVVINALQHAREWITIPTVLWFADTMLDDYATDAEVASILDAIDLHIVYVTNPDGYVYSHDFERLWRKNRRNNGDGTFGVDLNRNWSFQWGGGGSSGNPNSLTYRGTAPFSEPETTVLSDFILELPDAAAHLDVHSFGQLILSPFGFDFVEPAGVQGPVHEELGRSFAEFIEDVSGSIYEDRPAWSLYLADGTCSDWAHGAAGAISFTFELRPDSSAGGGFILPPEQIVPTAVENRAAFLDLCRAVANGVRIEFPAGLPGFLDASSPAPIDLLALPIATADLDPATARAFVNVPGEPLRVVALTPGRTEGSFSLALDPLPCGETIGLAFEIESVDGRIFREPASDAEFIEIPTFVATDIFADNSESDPGWTVENVALTGGGWDRGVPAGDGDRGDPTVDADGSGSAWLTENLAGNSDVDGGPTRLTSPTIDLSGLTDPLLRVSRWMRNDDGDTDRLRTLLSDDDGVTWVEVDAVNNLGDWSSLVVRVEDHIIASPTVRVRFTVADNPNNSVTEAGIDDVAFYTIGCPGGAADVNGDGTVDFGDLVQLLGAWGPCAGCPEDIDGDGNVGLGDLLEVLAAFS